MNDAGRKTDVEYWNAAWKGDVRLRTPSQLNIGVLNSTRLLRRHIRPGMRVLEIGYAPGKLLSWVAKELRADVAGIDYSPDGVGVARRLFAAIGLRGDLRCEDVFASSFAPASFDVVYSFGLVEHFDDPRDIVRRHVELAKPGGRVLVAVPNYGGVYGTLQQRCDPDNLAIHNLEIMSPRGMAELAPKDLARDVRAYASGRMSPWLVSMGRRLPAPVATMTSLALNVAALVQPFDIEPICPLVVLDMVRG